MSDCIFCKIIEGDIPSYKVYEDENVMAFLDLFPSEGRDGQVVVAIKKHIASKFSDVDAEDLKEIMLATKKISERMEQKLKNIERVLVVIEGLGVDHFHIKLYPAYKGMDRMEITEMGEKAEEQSLKKLQQTLSF